MVTKDFFRIFAEILIVHSYQNITPSLSNQPIYILALASSIISVFQTSLSIYLPWPVPSISVFQTSLSIYLQYTSLASSIISVFQTSLSIYLHWPVKEHKCHLLTHFLNRHGVHLMILYHQSFVCLTLS